MSNAEVAFLPVQFQWMKLLYSLLQVARGTPEWAADSWKTSIQWMKQFHSMKQLHSLLQVATATESATLQK